VEGLVPSLVLVLVLSLVLSLVLVLLLVEGLVPVLVLVPSLVLVEGLVPSLVLVLVLVLGGLVVWWNRGEQQVVRGYGGRPLSRATLQAHHARMSPACGTLPMASRTPSVMPWPMGATRAACWGLPLKSSWRWCWCGGATCSTLTLEQWTLGVLSRRRVLASR